MCPHGTEGDKLWGRETWALVCPWTEPDSGYVEDVVEWGSRDCHGKIPEKRPMGWTVWYSADSNDIFESKDDRMVKRYRSALSMPRWATRTSLGLTSIVLKRLNDITEIEAKAAVFCSASFDDNVSKPELMTAMDGLCSWWNSEYGKGSWSLNPWVWVLGCERGLLNYDMPDDEDADLTQ